MSKLEQAGLVAQTVLGEYGLSANASKAAPARVRAKIQKFTTTKPK